MSLDILKENLKKFVDLDGRSPAQISREAGLNEWYIQNILNGKSKNPKTGELARVAGSLNLTLNDLYANDIALPQGRSVPLRYRVCSARASPRPAHLIILRATESIAVPRRSYGQSGDFAAEVVDESADGLGYRPGDILICRPPADSLELGQRCLVRFPSGAPGDEPLEILVGVLDRSSSGDLHLTLRSSRHDLHGRSDIQFADNSIAGLDNTQSLAARRGDAIVYAPRAGDPGEILGRVIASIRSEDG